MKQDLILTQYFRLKLFKTSFNFQEFLISRMELHDNPFELFNLETWLQLRHDELLLVGVNIIVKFLLNLTLEEVPCMVETFKLAKQMCSLVKQLL